MDRYRIACYALLASAFLLGGMLIVQLGSIAGSTARAEMNISRDNFSLMTAATAGGDESLFVLDNANASLMVYSLDLGRKRLELAGGAKLADLFKGNGPVAGSGAGGNARGSR